MTQKCSRCNRHEPRPDRKTCEKCAEYARKTNAARREKKREWDRSEKGKAGARRRSSGYRREARSGAPSQLEVARMRELLLFKWASVRGYVPSTHEASRILGITLMGANIVRRRAFRLKDLSEMRGMVGMRVPFPVPEEFQASDDAVWTRVRWEVPHA